MQFIQNTDVPKDSYQIAMELKTVLFKNISPKPLPEIKIAVFFLLGSSLTLSILTTQVNASVDVTQLPFYWDAIDIEIDVQDNGDMLVTETQQYVFNREYSNERYRYIPLDRVDDITDVTVSENNSIIPSEVGKQGDRLWIKWQHELNPPESHAFAIEYRVIGGLQVNSDNTQVYWEAIFGDRQSPIQNARVIIKLPESLAGKISSYTYYADGILTSSQQLDEQTIEFVAQNPIPQKEVLEVKVVFPNNVLNIAKPKWQVSNTRNTIVFYTLFILSWLYAMLFGERSSSGSSSGCSGSGGSGGGGGGGGGGG